MARKQELLTRDLKILEKQWIKKSEKWNWEAIFAIEKVDLSIEKHEIVDSIFFFVNKIYKERYVHKPMRFIRYFRFGEEKDQLYYFDFLTKFIETKYI